MGNKFGWEKGDIEIIKQPAKKAKSHAEAARLLSIVQKAGPLRLTLRQAQDAAQDAASMILRTGARHNASDNTLIQQAHDILCSLGASCVCEQVDALRDYGEPNLQLMAAIKSAVKRDYKKEYRDYHGKPEQVAARSSRNKARRKMNGKKGDGKEIDHIDGSPMNNRPSNLRKVSRTTNRKKG